MEVAASGGGGGDVTPAVAGGAVGAQAGFVGFGSALADLKSAASKGVTLDPEAADALINSLKAGLDSAINARQAIGNTQMDDLPIGSTPAGALYKPTFARVSNDPTQGGFTAYKKLEKEIREAIETVQACVRETQANEERNASGIAGSGGDLFGGASGDGTVPC